MGYSILAGGIGPIFNILHSTEKEESGHLLGDMLHCSISPIEFVRILFSLLFLLSV